jgi:hypothetical protein
MKAYTVNINGNDIEVMQDNNGKFIKPDIVNKYAGYKAGKKPLKPCLEIIYVFRKPLKNSGIVADVLASETDDTINPACINVDGCRIGTDEKPKGSGNKCKSNNGEWRFKGNGGNITPDTGRYPSQLYTDTGAGELLDSQSGELTSGGGDKTPKVNSTFNSCPEKNGRLSNYIVKADKGGCSRILHKCDYDKDELVFYSPKVSNHERNAGCDKRKSVAVKSWHFKCKTCGKTYSEQEYKSGCKCENPDIEEWTGTSKNPHPTLKPMKLNYQILKLFKLPIEQTVFIPFSGAGSEVIPATALGYNVISCELSKEYEDIKNARLDYWQKNDHYYLYEDQETAKAEAKEEFTGELFPEY